MKNINILKYTAAGSLLSVMICLVMYAMLSRKESKTN